MFNYKNTLLSSSGLRAWLGLVKLVKNESEPSFSQTLAEPKFLNVRLGYTPTHKTHVPYTYTSTHMTLITHFLLSTNSHTQHSSHSHTAHHTQNKHLYLYLYKVGYWSFGKLHDWLRSNFPNQAYKVLDIDNSRLIKNSIINSRKSSKCT